MINLYDIYFLTVSVTVLIVRVLVFILPKPSPTVGGFRLHHWMYGASLTALLILVRGIFQNIYLLAIFMGIFLDEVGFIVIRGKDHEDNYSPKSFMWIMFFMILVFILKKPIVDFYLGI